MVFALFVVVKDRVLRSVSVIEHNQSGHVQSAFSRRSRRNGTYTRIRWSTFRRKIQSIFTKSFYVEAWSFSLFLVKLLTIRAPKQRPLRAATPSNWLSFWSAPDVDAGKASLWSPVGQASLWSRRGVMGLWGRAAGVLSLRDGTEQKVRKNRRREVHHVSIQMYVFSWKSQLTLRYFFSNFKRSSDLTASCLPSMVHFGSNFHYRWWIFRGVRIETIPDQGSWALIIQQTCRACSLLYRSRFLEVNHC